MTPDLLERWLFAFVFTQAVEVPIYLARPLRGRPLAAFGASALTHPFVAVVIPWLFSSLFAPVVWIPGETRLTPGFVLRALLLFALCEGFAVAVEAWYLRRLGAGRPLFWSLVANGASAVIGVFCTLFFGWP